MQCWCAASLLKHKVSRDQSLALAKQRLGFECKLEEAKCVHKELKKLMKLFTYDMDSSSKEVGKERVSQSAQSDQQELEGEVRESSPSLDCSEQRVSDKQDQTTPKSEKANGSRKSDLNKIIKEVHKISSKRRRSLGDKQMSELQEFYKKREESREREKAELFEKHRLESALIRTTTQMSVRSDKLKKVDEELTRKLEELNFRIETEKKEFEDKLNRARDRERRMKTHWLNEAKSGRSVTSFSLLPLPDSGFSMENMVTSEQAGVWDVREKTSTSAVPSSEINDFGGDILVMPVEDEPAEGLNNHANGAIEADIPTETSTQSTYPDGENDGIEIRASEEVALTGANHHRVASDSEDGRSTSLGQTQIAPSADTVEVPLHQVFCADGHPQPAISDRVQGDHMSSCEVPSTSQHFECSQVVSAEEHAQPSISDMLQCNNVSSSEVPSTSEQGEPSHQSILPPVTQLEIPPSIDPSYVEHVQPNPPTIREIEHQESQVPIGQPTEVQTELYINSGLQSQPELHHDYQSRQTSSNHAQVPQLSSEGHIVQFNHPISQPNAHLPDPRTIGAVPESSYRTPQTGPSTSRASMPFSTDPLENELQRLNKEDEISIKKHEHRKMELTSNCEKEIEEIRRKYNTQIHDAETVFVENRKIRESIFNKILMNKMLANTFSFKCTYAVAKSTGSTALQHGVYPGSVHQLSQLSSPPISQRPIYVPSPSVAPPAAPVAALPTASLAAPSLQMVHNSSAPAAPPLQVRYSSAPTAPPVPVAKHYLSTPAALPVPAVNHHPSAPMAPAVTPPLQVVHHSSALFSSIVRPHFNPVSPVVSHQVGSEIRAPAPHLQSFRPAPLVTSVMVSGQQSHKSPQIPRVPSYASVPFSRMHPTDCARGPAVGHPSFSHVDLLRDVDNRHAENQRNLLPPLPDLSPSVDAWVLQGPTAHTIIASDVVCLSDDD
ncbi:hypothetical protein GIB67_027596 [Kingdonia uniflora]|uniref:MOM1 alpha-helical domain-containing protein n=1 Tax=Kingdonia uniflora TaxID=39325 RepID=A0A7J7NLK3_9MAGN|nr:hypothetical protein GIB67_027596 [Kingdonia uniflora]